MMSQQKICVLVLLILSVHILAIYSQSTDETKITFVILSQSNSYHSKLAAERNHEILSQVEELHLENVKLYSVHKDFPNFVGYWTIFPLLPRLLSVSTSKWVFFLDDTTHLNVQKLINVLSKYNANKDVFGGYALKDEEPTIIHHYAHDNRTLWYPHFAAGFFMSYTLISRLASSLQSHEISFSIDPKYELAKFILEETGVRMEHQKNFCLVKTGEECVSWIDVTFPDCDAAFSSQKLFIAVKTCNKFHADRMKVVKDTWANEAEHVHIFSDVEDASIPTIQLNVANVASGHCEKTFTIMRYYIRKKIHLDWLIIVDDDTLLSYPRLKKLLSCYNSSEVMALGERYGYGVKNGLGYDYVTGGGGMVFSLSVVRKLVKGCSCPAIDSPDDMIIGTCLKKLNIPVTHSPYFHQARPVDYSPDFLKPLLHISFHKHWMIDPYHVYYHWLTDKKSRTAQYHLEL